MSSWENYYATNMHALPGAGLRDLIKLISRDMTGQTHGGEKALAGMIPIYGSWRRAHNEYQKAEDYYQNTGVDPTYSSDVSSLNSYNLAQMTGASVLPRMARTMTELYPAEILENVAVRMAKPQLPGRQKLLGRMDDVIDMEEY